MALTTPNDYRKQEVEKHLNMQRTNTTHYKVFDNQVYERRIVHQFKMSDVEDPDMWAGQYIYDWQQSDAGKWVMENAMQKPSWHRQFDIYSYGYQYQIRADLTDEQVTFFELKFK